MATYAILFMILTIQAIKGEVNWFCPDKWSSLSDGQFECMWVSSDTATKEDAQNECQKMESNLVTILSEEKSNSVQNLMMKNRITNTHLGLYEGDIYRGYNRLEWQTSSGRKKLEYNEDKLLSSNYGECVTMLSDGRWNQDGCYGNEYLYYICEKRAVCAIGWFGPRCDRKCHCYRYGKCDQLIGDWTCPYGCEAGWRGPKCDEKREKASLNYYCVNPVEGDKHVNIQIDTKGIHTRIIEPLSDTGHIVTWCSNTEYKDNHTNIKQIRIWLTEDAIQEMDQGTCAGKKLGNNTYEWRLAIQEWQGLLLPDDQDILIRCNFSNGETLSRSDGASIAGKYDVETTMVNESKADVVLELADASSKKTLNSSSVGNPVILQVKFGLNKGSKVKSVSPYDCEAISVTGTKNMLFIDSNGCQVDGTPVGPFDNSTINKTMSDHLIETRPFRYFTFHGDQHITFKCSFIFCFDTNCPVGCGIKENWIDGTAFVRADRKSDEVNGYNNVGGLLSAADYFRVKNTLT